MTKNKGKSPPRSLFVQKVEPLPLPPGDLDAQIKTMFMSMTAPSMVQGFVAQILAAAQAAETDDAIAKGAEYAQEIRQYAQKLQVALSNNDAHKAAYAGMKLTEKWMMLRIDAAFAKPIRTEQQRLRNFPNKSQRPPDAEIQGVVRRIAGRQAQARELGTTVRTLNRWLKDMK